MTLALKGMNYWLAGHQIQGQAAIGDFYMSKDDQAIEAEIQSKGLNAPRVTPQDIEANIAGEYFFTADQATKDCPQLDRVTTFAAAMMLCCAAEEQSASEITLEVDGLTLDSRELGDWRVVAMKSASTKQDPKKDE